MTAHEGSEQSEELVGGKMLQKKKHNIDVPSWEVCGKRKGQKRLDKGFLCSSEKCKHDWIPKEKFPRKRHWRLRDFLVYWGHEVTKQEDGENLRLENKGNISMIGRSVHTA